MQKIILKFVEWREATDVFGIAFTTKSINGPYVVDPLRFPRKHLWTYAIRISNEGTLGTLHCPCTANPGAVQIIYKV